MRERKVNGEMDSLMDAKGLEQQCLEYEIKASRTNTYAYFPVYAGTESNSQRCYGDEPASRGPTNTLNWKTPTCHTVPRRFSTWVDRRMAYLLSLSSAIELSIFKNPRN